MGLLIKGTRGRTYKPWGNGLQPETTMTYKVP
jgi:hypothetical protein